MQLRLVLTTAVIGLRLAEAHAAISTLREGELRVRLDEHRATLLAIKRGERPWPEVNAGRLSLHKEFGEAFATTRLHERPDYAWANEFLLKARREQVESAKQTTS